MLKQAHKPLNRSCLCALLALILAAISLPAAAGDEARNVRTLEYITELDGSSIGTRKVNWKRFKDGRITIRGTERIDAFGVFTYDLDAEHVWEKGQLVSFKVDQNENGEKVVITGTKSGDGLMIEARSKSRIIGEGNIQYRDFDTSYMGLAMYLQRVNYTPGRKPINVLSTVTGELNKVSLQPAGNETLTVAGKDFKCLKFRYEDKEGSSMLWLADADAAPFIIKEEHNDSDGKLVQTLDRYRESTFKDHN